MSSRKTPRPCGSWPSSITAAMCAETPEAAIAGAMFELQSNGQSLYWLAARPSEQGRNALVSWDLEHAPVQVVDPPWNIRTGVNEYGGAAYVATQGCVYFSHYADSRLYRQASGGTPEPLTPEGPYRYADLIHDGIRKRLICVREDFTGVGDTRREEATELVGIDLETGKATVLASGPDFVSSPRLSPDGAELAWISWNHPNMPWDDTALHCARIAPDGSFMEVRTERTPTPQARMQPGWSPDGELYYLSDATDAWNLYRWRGDGDEGEQLTRLDGEIGMPAWVLGLHHFDFVNSQRISVLYTSEGYWHAATVDCGSGAILDRAPAQAMLSSLVAVNGRCFVIGADERGAGGLYEYVDGRLELMIGKDAAAAASRCSTPSIAVPLTIPLPATDHTAPGEVCYAWYYPPANPDHEVPSGEKPPVIVQFHGGPTAASWAAFSLYKQYWTSRGFAVLDVNYRGSSGRGRRYRQRLYGGYGILDVEDAVATLRHAAELGLVDAERAAIYGASSGGYTTLAALAFHDAFAVGVNLFGLSDLSVFVHSTHKFESRYIATLAGGADETALRSRSPSSRLDNINAPLLTLQGSADKIVPPQQSHIVIDAVRRKGLPCAYIEFEGEGHGFRRRETIIRALEATLSFYAQILGFEPADAIEPVAIENL